MSIQIHSLSDVQTISIGNNTSIWQFCVVLKGARIGHDCNICSHCLIENDVIIGDRVTIKSGVQIWDGVKIEDNVFIGPNVTFTNDLVPRSKNENWNLLKTLIEAGASVGANSTVIAGIRIGKFALIGAGSVVTKNVPCYTVWYGNPAKFTGFVTKTGVILDLELKDKDGNCYYLNNKEPVRK